MAQIPFIFIGLGLFVLLISLGFHKIEEGHVGVYFRGGALLPDTTDPGYRWMFPILTSYYNVQVTVQTDEIKEIPVLVLLILVWN